MQARFGQSDDLYLVLANYFIIGGRQVDLTVLKRDAIIVIELKEGADPFRATENGDWTSILDGNGLRGTHQAAQIIFHEVEKARSNCRNLSAQVNVLTERGNSVALFAVGVVDEVQVVEEYLIDHIVLPHSSLRGAEMAGWSQAKTCEVLESAISKIADHRDEIDKKDVNKKFGCQQLTITMASSG
jgi:hypothetical protein